MKLAKKKPKLYAQSEVVRSKTDESFVLIKEKSYHPKLENLKSKIQLINETSESEIHTGKKMDTLQKFIVYSVANILLNRNYKLAYKISTSNFIMGNSCFKANIKRLYVISAEGIYIKFRKEEGSNSELMSGGAEEQTINQFLYEAV